MAWEKGPSSSEYKKVQEKTGFKASTDLVIKLLGNYLLEDPVNCSKNCMAKRPSATHGEKRDI